MFENSVCCNFLVVFYPYLSYLVKNCKLELSDPEAFYRVRTFESGGTLPVSGQG